MYGLYLFQSKGRMSDEYVPLKEYLLRVNCMYLSHYGEAFALRADTCTCKW